MKSYREKMLDIIEEDIIKAERKIKNDEEYLAKLKAERFNLMAELSEDEMDDGGSPILFFKGFEGL